jgi:hypothetical protein
MGLEAVIITAVLLKKKLSSVEPNLHRLERVGSIWRLYSRCRKPRHEMKYLKEKGREEIWRILTDTAEKKVTEEELGLY